MQGVSATFQLARQNSGNTAVTAMTSFHPIPFLSESMVTNLAELVSDGMRGRYDEGPISQGLLTVQGDVVFYPHWDTLPLFFRALTGVQSTSQINSCYQHLFPPTQAEFDDNLALPPYTVEVYKDGQNAHQFTDAVLGRLALEIAGGQFLRGTGSWVARVSSEKAATTPTYQAGAEFTWNQASVSLGGVAFPHFENLTFTFDNALEGVPMLDGNREVRKVRRTGFRTLRVAGTLDIPVNSSAGMFADYRAGTERQLIVTVQNPTALSSGAYYQAKIDVPAFRYASWPVAVNGPGRVTVGIEGRAVYSTASATLFRLTVQNTREAY